MRVITGSARGRRLREPEGTDTRPTTDRVKEGLFSAIQFAIPGRTALDLFAGTGQLGIECLSRGAASCVFVDDSPKALACVRENLKRTGLSDRGRVVSGDALAFLRSTGGRGGASGQCGATERNGGTLEQSGGFGLILLDPPYGSGLLEAALETIAAPGILAPGGIVTAEHPADAPPPVMGPSLRIRKTYRYGKIAVTLYERDGPEPPPRESVEYHQETEPRDSPGDAMGTGEEPA